ncbi:hypothetical protein M0R88_10125 [Halorussus gelatinilyticus]|uniref:Uncharacterized protein n=1 Tax=Halorussus gelatinilyticus TaxID=2937524 RepID=A0A8U0IFR1_9EURY|nr:hypothetical protein [Halorussus gelatinilyticus]UPV98888.1 hypothetical protein M0R88_10125 [Halorussus gelatinilyticus]
MAIDYASVYLGILFVNFLYLVVLLYGGIWYTNRVTVQCPRCGIKYSKYRVENHECPPSLVGDSED